MGQIVQPVDHSRTPHQLGSIPPLSRGSLMRRACGVVMPGRRSSRSLCPRYSRSRATLSQVPFVMQTFCARIKNILAMKLAYCLEETMTCMRRSGTVRVVAGYGIGICQSATELPAAEPNFNHEYFLDQGFTSDIANWKKRWRR